MAQKLTTKLIRGFYATDIVSDGETLTIKDSGLALEVLTQLGNQRDVWILVMCPEMTTAGSSKVVTSTGTETTAIIQSKIPVTDRCG